MAEPTSFNQRDIKLANGRKYHLCDELPECYEHGKTPVLLCIHGFPEYWYEWRYLIGPFVRRGWRVLAPDTLGYGGTVCEEAYFLSAQGLKYRMPQDKPSDRSLYTPLSMAAEMAALLTALDLLQPVVIVGHDWGAAAAWAFAFTPLGACEKLLKDETKIAGPTDVMSAKERAFYIETFEREGIDAPMNYYRSADCRYEQEQALKLDPVLPKSMPILFIATKEPFCTPARVEATRPFVPSMEVERLASNHFVMLEKRDEVAQIIGDWVEKKLEKQNT
ncbi:hypothetical protein FRB97_004305 [Tulasnella sp. 331]|nr:hypothetical protein FRB97_004305 [Tulasnella sp. 331]